MMQMVSYYRRKPAFAIVYDKAGSSLYECSKVIPPHFQKENSNPIPIY